MSQADNVVAFPGPGRRGDFFAVDRRAWARACALGMNAAVAYLVLARGTGADQRTTAWSVHAIETRTGIGRPRAQRALAALAEAALLRLTRPGARPRYHVAPAHEVPGCEGFPPPALDAVEQKLYDQLAAGLAWVPNKTGREWDYHNLRVLAAALVRKGRAREAGKHRYVAVPYDAEAAVRPDWTWLPNALVDGADGDLAAPVELVRQTQSAAALRLLVDLYHAQSLASDGGIHWRSIRQEFTRHTVGRRGPFVVYGFAPGTVSAFGDKPLVRAHMTGAMEVAPGSDRPRDRGWDVFWAAWHQLVALGLVAFVAHVVEADAEEAEVVHPLRAGGQRRGPGAPARARRARGGRGAADGGPAAVGRGARAVPGARPGARDRGPAGRGGAPALPPPDRRHRGLVRPHGRVGRDGRAPRGAGPAGRRRR
jgi:hypothetical protein